MPTSTLGTTCDLDGDDIEPSAPPPPPHHHAEDDFSPFSNCAEFKLAEFLYVKAKMSAGKIDQLLNLLASLYDGQPPFMLHQELYSTIDAIKQGEIPWNSFSITYNGVCPQQNPPTWMNESYEVWFRSPLQVLKGQIANPEYENMMDFALKWVYHKGKCQYSDLLSRNWAWDQAVCHALLTL